jgi:hypothetical protein
LLADLMGSRDLVGDGTLVERFADGLIQALQKLRHALAIAAHERRD